MDKIFVLYSFFFLSNSPFGSLVEFNPKHIRKAMPKDIPEMIMVPGKTDTVRYEAARYSSVQSAISYYMSKYEITNQDFCKFLNVDSIGGNREIVERIIELDGKHCKIVYDKDSYKPLRGIYVRLSN